MTYQIHQKFPTAVACLPEPTQEDIRQEPNFRRASADFVRRQGGDLARAFLEKTEALGLITDQSRFMCQRSPIVKGAYPSPPNWHIDRMPGTKFHLQEHLDRPVTGAIACICSKDKIETTEFLSEGELFLNEPACTEAVHKPGQYLDDEQGQMNWTTSQIARLLKAGKVKKRSIEANKIYRYDSTYFHNAPCFRHEGGYRIILRVNTPPEGFPYQVATNDFLLKNKDFFFLLSEDGRTWRKFMVDP